MFQFAQHRSGIGRKGPDPTLVNSVVGPGVEMVPALAASPFSNNQSGLFEYAQMLHHGAPINFGDEVAHRS